VESLRLLHFGFVASELLIDLGGRFFPCFPPPLSQPDLASMPLSPAIISSPSSTRSVTAHPTHDIVNDLLLYCWAPIIAFLGDDLIRRGEMRRECY
jgi:hypothetical protein